MEGEIDLPDAIRADQGEAASGSARMTSVAKAVAAADQPHLIRAGSDLRRRPEHDVHR
jgi:hypothetical protein